MSLALWPSSVLASSAAIKSKVIDAFVATDVISPSRLLVVLMIAHLRFRCVQDQGAKES